MSGKGSDDDGGKAIDEEKAKGDEARAKKAKAEDKLDQAEAKKRQAEEESEQADTASKKADAEDKKAEAKKDKAEAKQEKYEAEFDEDLAQDSDLRSDRVDTSLEPFFESDMHETPMTFDKGGFPLYVKAAWAVFLVSVTYYMYVYALPDLTAWGAP